MGLQFASQFDRLAGYLVAPGARITIVEDDRELAEWMASYLQQNGFVTDICLRGETALQRLRRQLSDLVILDINLPGINGFEVCKQLREFFDNPVIMVTANDEEFDEVLGLELGADDYITKPVTPRVLLARINAQLRSGAAAARQLEDLLQFGSLKIDLQAQSVTLEDQAVALSSGEFELLWVLACHAGSEVRREDLVREIRGFDYDGFDRTIDVRISRLRKKLGDHSNPPKRIKTIWGKGYLFAKNAW